MSKISRPFLLIFPAAVLILQLFNNSKAQEIEAELSIDPEHVIVHVEGAFLNERVPSSQPVAFLSDYAGIRFPADRITNVKRNGNSWSYDVDVAPMKEPTAAAHVSWMTPDGGIMMLDDLLPQSTRTGAKQTAKLTVITPQALFSYVPLWPINTTEKHLEDGSYWIADTAKAVIYLRFEAACMLDTFISGKPIRSTSPCILTSRGTFLGPPMETLEVADQIYREYRSLFRAERRPLVIGLARFLGKQPQGSWEADTRGKTITVITSDTAFKSQALQQLHEQLRHEMFHLWIPEGVNLTGHYDWFYEGFALYQSLKLGVAVNRIRFDDYLDTLSRAYETDKRLRQQESLIDASKNRWTNDNNTVVYARGMLVAFLCDLALLNATNGKLSTDEIVREVYSRHSGSAAPRDGNAAVIAILKSHKELVPIVDRYVSGADAIDWSGLVRAAGLQVDTSSGVTTITVLPKPSGSQKRLLDKLGYNSWRKLSSK